MKETGFRLREKTVIIFGSLSGITKAAATLLTENGADVAFVGVNESKEFERYASSLNDAREISDKLGRAMFIASPLTDANQAKDVVSRVAEAFGSVDVYVDAQFVAPPLSFSDGNALSHVESFLSGTFFQSTRLAHASLQFLLGRKKGRMVFLVNGEELYVSGVESLSAMRAGALQGLVKALTMEAMGKAVAVNVINLGLTEEFLMARSPGDKTIESAREAFTRLAPRERLIEATEVAQMILFLASPLSQAINGATLPAHV